VGILIGIPIVGVLKVIFDYVVAELTRGFEGAERAMEAEPTDEVGQEAVGQDRSEPSNATQTEAGEAAGIHVPSYSPF